MQLHDVHEGIHNSLVEIAVDSTTVDRLLDERTDRVPRNGCGIDIRATLGDTVEPSVYRGERRCHVGVVEVVRLAPSEWGVSQTLLHDGMEPSEEEV